MSWSSVLSVPMRSSNRCQIGGQTLRRMTQSRHSLALSADHPAWLDLFRLLPWNCPSPHPSATGTPPRSTKPSRGSTRCSTGEPGRRGLRTGRPFSSIESDGHFGLPIERLYADPFGLGIIGTARNSGGLQALRVRQTQFHEVRLAIARAFHLGLNAPLLDARIHRE